MTGFTISAEEFTLIRDLVQRLASIVIGVDKKYFVEARLIALMTREKLSSFEPLMNAIRALPVDVIHHKVVDAMTTNETLFFRDVHPFDALRRHILPELIRERSATRSLNVFFVGCATGQEPYSLAMLIRDAFPDLLQWNLNLLAVDISTHALRRARAGIYTQFEMNRGLPAHYMIKYFNKVGVDWQVKDEVRAMVEFRQMNITGPLPPLPQMDLIFMRNILIYFSEDTKKKVFREMRQLLKPDGCLLLGTAETPIYLDPNLESLTYDNATCYRARPNSRHL